MRFFVIAAITVLSAVASARSENGEYQIEQIDSKAGHFTVKLNGEIRTFRVRPSVEVTLNGLKSSFGELEPGMKVKVTSAEPGLATRLAANGLRTRTVPEPTRPLSGAAAQEAREMKAAIPANSPNAYPIADIRKGTKIVLQYLSGKWKCEGHIAQYSPDDVSNPKFSDNNRLVISLPSADDKPGEILAVVPGGTADKPFIFEAQNEYPQLVLRIHDYNGFATNPGGVEYKVRIVPPEK